MILKFTKDKEISLIILLNNLNTIWDWHEPTTQTFKTLPVEVWSKEFLLTNKYEQQLLHLLQLVWYGLMCRELFGHPSVISCFMPIRCPISWHNSHRKLIRVGIVYFGLKMSWITKLSLNSFYEMFEMCNRQMFKILIRML